MDVYRIDGIEGVGWFLYEPELHWVCLHRRDGGTKIDPNSWDVFGGSVEEGDASLKHALLREVQEELGLTMHEDEPVEISRKDGKALHYIPFPFSRTSEIVLGEGAGFAWTTIEAALGLKDLTTEAREGLQLFIERFGK